MADGISAGRVGGGSGAAHRQAILSRADVRARLLITQASDADDLWLREADPAIQAVSVPPDTAGLFPNNRAVSRLVAYAT
jgi:hypothetical protein